MPLGSLREEFLIPGRKTVFKEELERKSYGWKTSNCLFMQQIKLCLWVRLVKLFFTCFFFNFLKLFFCNSLILYLRYIFRWHLEPYADGLKSLQLSFLWFFGRNWQCLRLQGGISRTTLRTTGLEYTANFYKQLRAACYATVENLQLRAARWC